MSQRKPPNLFFRFSTMAIQMAVIIGLAVWGGKKLDTNYENRTPVFTIVFSLLGIGAAMYLALKDLLKPPSKKQ